MILCLLYFLKRTKIFVLKIHTLNMLREPSNDIRNHPVTVPDK